jgi:hypothetical protein
MCVSVTSHTLSRHTHLDLVKCSSFDLPSSLIMTAASACRYPCCSNCCHLNTSPHTGQLRHVMDERKLLSLMNSRFVLKLHGTATVIVLPLLFFSFCWIFFSSSSSSFSFSTISFPIIETSPFQYIPFSFLCCTQHLAA